MGGYTYILLSDTHTKVGMSKVEFPKRVKDQLKGRFKGFQLYATINDSFFEYRIINCLNFRARKSREVFPRNEFLFNSMLEAMIYGKEIKVNRAFYYFNSKRGMLLAEDADQLSKLVYTIARKSQKHRRISSRYLNYTIEGFEGEFNYLARTCREEKPEIIFHHGCYQ